MTESQIQSETLRRLAAYDTIRIWRQNTGAANYAGRTVRFGVPGAADLSGIAFPSGKRIEIELKKPGGKQSDAQRKYGQMITDMGGVYICSSDPDAIVACLKRHGVIA